MAGRARQSCSEVHSTQGKLPAVLRKAAEVKSKIASTLLSPILAGREGEPEASVGHQNSLCTDFTQGERVSADHERASPSVILT